MVEYQYSGQLALINLFLWIILYLKYKKSFTKIVPHSNKILWLFIFLIIYGIFAFAEADTYHYHSGYEEMYQSKIKIHIEDFYFWLIQMLPHNYYLWRFAIWGTSAIILLKTAQFSKLNTRVLGFVFCLIFTYNFPLTRGVLGCSILIYSLYIICKNKKSILTILAFIFLISIAINLHRSLPIFILLLPIAFLFPLNKKTIVLSIVIFPFLYKFTGIILSEVLSLSFLAENTVEKGLSHLERERTELNFNGYFFIFLHFTGIVLLLISAAHFYIQNKTKCPKFFLINYKYSFVLIYIGLLLFEQNMSSFLSSRALHMASFPMIFSITYYLQKSGRSKICKLSFILLLLYSFYKVTYYIYKWW